MAAATDPLLRLQLLAAKERDAVLQPRLLLRLGLDGEPARVVLDHAPLHEGLPAAEDLLDAKDLPEVLPVSCLPRLCC